MTIFDLATQAALDGLTQQVVLADTLFDDRLIVLADRVTKLEAPPVVVPPSPPPPPVVTNPGAVTTLRLNAATETTLGLRFTEIDNGAGQPANYLVRIAPSPMSWGATPNAVVLPGQLVGAPREFLLPSLQPNTKYDIQMIAFRGTLNVDAIFGPLSAVLTATTAAVVVPPVIPPIIVPPTAGLLFASDWVSGTPRDNWTLYDEFRGNRIGDLMSVVPGFGPGGRNALKVLQHGSQAANLRKQNVITPGQDYYVRFYFRTDDVSSAADHIVTCELYTYGNLTYLRKSGGPMDWRHTVSFYGCGYVYPIGHWFLRNRLPNHTWFRMEFFVHWTSPTAVQVHPRISDEAGVLLYTDADYQQSDPGSQLWNGKSDWTLASYYTAGYDFCVRPEFLTEFGLGNNGQTGALDNGLSWFFSGVEIRTDRWPGP